MTRTRKYSIVVCSLLAPWLAAVVTTIWPITLAAVRAAEINLDGPFLAVASYGYGDDRKPLQEFEQLVRHANSLGGNDAGVLRQKLADRTASLLSVKEPTSAAKAFLCGQLALIGTEKQAPALSSLLADRELANPALSALAQIPGPAVDRILRDSLGTLKGGLRIGAVNALGQRRDHAATGCLTALLWDADDALACAAANALGKIGSEAALVELQKALAKSKGRLRTEVAHACLRCADQLVVEKKGELAAAVYAQLIAASERPEVRMAALRGRVLANAEEAASAVCDALVSGDPALENMALQLVPQVPGPAATEQFAACLGKPSAPVQALLLGALSARQDAAARLAVETAASSNDPAVRLAALQAIGVCGDESSVKTLLDRTIAGPAPESEAARQSLVRLRGKGVNEILAAAIARHDARAKTQLIRFLAARNAVGEVADVKKAAEDPDAGVRKEAWKALGGLAKGPDVPSLVDLLVRARDDDRDGAENAIAAVLKRPDRPDVRAVLERLDAVQMPAARAALLRIVSMVGDDRALGALRKAIQSEEAVVRDAAVRGLAAWPTPAVFEDLLSLARHAKDPVHRVLALRAAIRLSSKVEGRTPEKMTGFIAELIQLADQSSERKAVFAELGRCTTPDALRLAQKYLADPELATEAGVAVTEIASAIHQTHRDAALAALRPLLAGRHDPLVVGRALKTLKDILKPANLALGATASSPDGLESDGSSRGDQAAVDGDSGTFWDEVDNADQYRLKVTLPQPAEVSSIHILWHPYEQHQAKNLDVLCDGKLVKEVRNAKCFEHEMFVAFGPVRCASVELVIPGKNGLVSPCIHELQVFGPFVPPAAGSGDVQPLKPPKLTWKQTDGVLALLNHDRVVWQFNYGKDLAKPFFHPVASTDGTVLTAPSPADHPWHRALWFSWKMLNGVNYWEEDPKTGKSQGITAVQTARVSPNADGSARIKLAISYHPAGAPVALTEDRLIEISAPDKTGVYRIDWRGRFTAGEKDVLLQGGTAGGGYAGLSVRISQTSRDWLLIDSEGRRDDATGPANPMGVATNTHGKRARWMDFSLADAATGRPCGIAILDHPSNPRHPSQWHNVMAAPGRFGYFSPAMLWSEPYKLPPRQRFTLRYRILVHSGRSTKDAIENEWRAFAPS